MNRHALSVIAAGVTLAFAHGVANAAESGKPAAKSKVVSAKTLARGKYMVQTGHCNNCHTSGFTKAEGNIPEKDWLLGSAPLGYRGPWGTTYSSNLRLTAPKFTQEQWVKYAKTMKARPPMPWWPLRDTTDADLAAMYQYIKHLGPAGQMAPDFVPPGQEPKPPYEKRELVN
jgi:mono/diheme cytochrome c family protein